MGRQLDLTAVPVLLAVHPVADVPLLLALLSEIDRMLNRNAA